MGTILVKSALKIEVFKKIKCFIEEIQFSGTFFVIDIFWKLQFLKHLKHFLLKLCPFFVSWFWSFVKRYEIDLKGHFWSVVKVVIRIGCATWNSNLKSYLLHISFNLFFSDMRIYMLLRFWTWSTILSATCSAHQQC